MKAAIIDYGAGNLYSLKRGIERAGIEAVVTDDVSAALRLDVMVLPGVGGFANAARFLCASRDSIRTAVSEGFPCLGICLGMQLLFDSSEEGDGAGLGIIPGKVRRLNTERVPQMGWNSLENVRDPAIRAASLETAYFANSFVCEPDEPSVITAWSTHESDRFVAAVRSGTVAGVQFHPEKSSVAGIGFIAEFMRSIQ